MDDTERYSAGVLDNPRNLLSLLIQNKQLNPCTLSQMLVQCSSHVTTTTTTTTTATTTPTTTTTITTITNNSDSNSNSYNNNFKEPSQNLFPSTLFFCWPKL